METGAGHQAQQILACWPLGSIDHAPGAGVTVHVPKEELLRPGSPLQPVQGMCLQVSCHPTPKHSQCQGALRTLHVTSARMEKDQVQLCLQVATLERQGRGRREPVLRCLPALGASQGITSPSAPKEMVQLWQSSWMLSDSLHVACRTWWPIEWLCVCLQPTESNPVLVSILRYLSISK